MFLERSVVELVYKFDNEILLRMFEKVSRLLKHDSKLFLVHKHMTPTPMRVRGNNVKFEMGMEKKGRDTYVLFIWVWEDFL